MAAIASFLEGDAPNARKESRDAFDALHLPWLHLLERPHEHFVKPQGIGAVLAHDIIGIHDIAARLRHFLPVLAEDEALVDEFLEWLGRADMAEVEQHLVPEACVKQVQDRMLGAADIEVDHAR